jgi:hypothetical protein
MSRRARSPRKPAISGAEARRKPGAGIERTGRLLIATALVVAVASSSAAAASDPPFSDPEVLLDSLRSSVKATLPRTELKPLSQFPRYELALALDKSLTSYALDERIAFTNTASGKLPELVLRLFANATHTPPPISFSNLTCAPRSCRATMDGPSTIRVVPTGGIAPGETLEVTLHLDATLPVTPAEQTSIVAQSLAGLSAMTGGGQHKTDYGLLGFSDGMASMAHAFAVVARQNKSGFIRREKSTMGDLGTDEMSFVHAKVRVPSDVSIAATGVVVRDGAIDGVAYFTVTAGMIRDFALLASRSYAYAAQKVGDVTVRSHFLVRDRASGERVLDFASHALAIFERRFGPYPYRNLDVVEAPVVGGAGGVEFSGLVTVASMFYRPMTADSGLLGQLMAGMGQVQGPILEFTTAHEVAHQYWHGLVGSDSREHPYLDESLAQFSAILYDEDRYGMDRANQDADMHVRMNYRMMRMMGERDGAVEQPVDAFGSPMRYAGLVYGKGACFFPKARELLGDAAFYDGLRRYVSRYGFRMATPANLRDELGRGSPQFTELQKLARRWFEQSHGDDDLGKADIGSLLAGALGGAGGGGEGDVGALGSLGDLFGPLGNQVGAGGVDIKGLLKNLNGADVQQLLKMLQGSGLGELGH